MDAIVREMDEEFESFLADARSDLSLEEWELIKDYAAGCVRQALEVGAMLRAIAMRDGCGAAHPGRGKEVFVRDALVAWRDAYAPIRDVWRISLVFDRIEGGERRLLADVATLEAMAANRMFDALDEEAAALLARGA